VSISFGKFAGVVALLCVAGCMKGPGGSPVATEASKPKQAAPIGEMKPTERIRPECPIRLGGVFLMGLGDASADYEDSAGKGVKLSDSNRNWLAAHCDLAALSPNTIAPDTFPAVRRQQRLFTSLLYLYASSLYEQPDHKGNVGGWTPQMTAWTLRDSAGREAKHPDAGGHWMDFGNMLWAAHWRKQTELLAGHYGAFGALAAEMPQAEVAGREDLGKYKTQADRGVATEAWLRAAIDPGKYLLVPSALGFDQSIGHPTPAYPPGIAEPELVGRYWDQFHNITDGAWAEGWIYPYWADDPLPDATREIQMEAADRAARTDKVFLATTAYRTDAELEYVLASYLLVAKRQSRVVFQPMPLRPGQPTNAGMSLAVMKREVAEKSAYFDAPLGVALQERHSITLQDGSFWRRAYQFGDVYVNSNDDRSVTVELAGKMLRVNGKIVQRFVLAPHRGAILRYLPNPQK
jgi:hypothetical protein